MSIPNVIVVDDACGIEEAIGSAQEGDIVRIPEGEFVLSEPLILEKSIIIQGAGMDQTKIVCNEPECVAHFKGFFRGNVVCVDIAFEHRGPQGAHVVVVEDGGQMEFYKCRFRGGRRREEKGGNGLLVIGNPLDVLNFRFCEFAHNDLNGIELKGGFVKTVLYRNQCNDNGKDGIVYDSIADIEVYSNTCNNNSDVGISINDGAHSILEGNLCSHNSIGISYYGYSAGVIRNNECSENERGIQLCDRSRSLLERNYCHGNKYYGIGYHNNATGIARNNECSGNRIGIRTLVESQAVLESNYCYNNKQGIDCDKGSGAMIRNNKLIKNDLGVGADSEAHDHHKTINIYYINNTEYHRSL